ncbi:TolB family protein [Phycisphaerales bacterium AB-hyl4]|uniref:TolB family protein n=1 Tax=Natronomicrosphaera hydrolytica TaxID=3242702 RepID=A0ABV4U901_9BACT
MPNSVTSARQQGGVQLGVIVVMTVLALGVLISGIWFFASPDEQAERPRSDDEHVTTPVSNTRPAAAAPVDTGRSLALDAFQSARAEHPTLEPEVSKIVYSRFPYGTKLIDEDGMEWDLTYHSGEHAALVISPDHDRALFTYPHDEADGLWVLGLDPGTGARHLWAGSQGSWSPDGQSVVYQRDGHIYRRPLDGGEAQRVSPAGVEDAAWPIFSPNGDSILFVAGADESDKRALHVVPAQGGSEARVLVSGEIYSRPAWSPDGQQIAYQDGARIALTDPRGESVRYLTAEGGFHAFPVWSQDGHGVAYNHAPRPEGPWRLRAVDVAGAHRSVLLEVAEEQFTGAPSRQEDMDAGAGIVWSSGAGHKIGRAPGVHYAVDDDQATLSLSADLKLALRSERAEVLANAMTADHHVTLALRSDDVVSIQADAAKLVVPDRLGDDLIIEIDDLTDEPMDLSHARYVLAMLNDGKGVAVFCVPEGGMVARKAADDERDGTRLELTGGGMAHVGMLSAGEATWTLGSDDWEPTFDAVWRIVGSDGSDGSGVQAWMAGFGEGETDDERKAMFDKIHGSEGRSALIYPFERTSQTPIHLVTVSDVLTQAMGVASADRILQREAVARYHEPERWTTFPTVDKTLDFFHRLYISPSVMAGGFHADVPDDLVNWSEDLKVLLRWKDERIEAYAAFASNFEQASLADGKFDAHREKLSELASARDEMTPQDELNRWADRMKSGELNRSDVRGSFLPKMREAAEQRQTLLHDFRQAVRRLRTDVNLAMTSPPSEDERSALLAVQQQTAELLGRRIIAEADWRGELVVRRYTDIAPATVLAGSLRHGNVQRPNVTRHDRTPRMW